jgi:hypothetical protein
MTPEPARKDSGLFVEDSELLRRLGIPEKVGYRALAKLDRDERSDFPQKNAFWGQRGATGRLFSITSTRHVGQSTCEPPHRMSMWRLAHG